jgi:hypothetical protein
MSSLFCNICNISFSQKYNYSRHLKTKKHIENVKKSSVCNTNVTQCNTNVTQCNTNVTQSVTQCNTNVTQHNNFKYICKYCNNSFKSHSSYYRHMKHYCKNKQQELIPYFKDKQELIEYVKKELSNEFLVPAIPSDLNNCNKDITNNSHYNTNTNTNINNTLNSTTLNNNSMNNNSVTNSVNNNITINAFGHEDLTFLKEEDILNVLSQMRNGVPELVRIIHRQENNRNFFIKNSKKNIGVYLGENNELRHIDTDLMISQLVKVNMDRYSEYFSEYKNKMEQELIEKIDNVIATNMNDDNQYLYNHKVTNTALDYSQANKKALRKIQNI